MTKKDPFNFLWLELQNFDSTQPLNKTAIQRLTNEAMAKAKSIMSYREKHQLRMMVKELTNQYRIYKRSKFMSHNENLKGWRLNELSPDLRRELKRRIMMSTQLLKTTRPGLENILRNRFLGFLGSADRKNAKKELKLMATIKSKDKRVKNVITDQTRKMIGQFDKIVAEHYKAIGFYWNGREDKRVVGNPSGLYPDADDNSKVHGDHWSRQGKFYFYKNNDWVVKQGLVNTKSKDFHWAEFKDGMPSEPINCRCWAYNVYDLFDVPESLLTEKGEAYLKHNMV